MNAIIRFTILAVAAIFFGGCTDLMEVECFSDDECPAENICGGGQCYLAELPDEGSSPDVDPIDGSGEGSGNEGSGEGSGEVIPEPDNCLDEIVDMVQSQVSDDQVEFFFVYDEDDCAADGDWLQAEAPSELACGTMLHRLPPAITPSKYSNDGVFAFPVEIGIRYCGGNYQFMVSRAS